MALGELFTLVVYAQLILENATIYRIDDDTVDQIFDFMVRDFSKFALELHGKPSSTPEQQAYCLRMLRKPAVDTARYARVWREAVYALNDVYDMPA
jgi:acyl-CoA dehydrogenase